MIQVNKVDSKSYNIVTENNSYILAYPEQLKSKLENLSKSGISSFMTSVGDAIVDRKKIESDRKLLSEDGCVIVNLKDQTGILLEIMPSDELRGKLSVMGIMLNKEISRLKDNTCVILNNLPTDIPKDMLINILNDVIDNKITDSIRVYGQRQSSTLKQKM